MAVFDTLYKSRWCETGACPHFALPGKATCAKHTHYPTQVGVAADPVVKYAAKTPITLEFCIWLQNNFEELIG